MLCSAQLGDGDRGLFYRRRHPWNPRLPWERGGLEAEGRREGVKGEVRVSGLTGSRDMNGCLMLLQKRQLPQTEWWDEARWGQPQVSFILSFICPLFYAQNTEKYRICFTGRFCSFALHKDLKRTSSFHIFRDFQCSERCVADITRLWLFYWPCQVVKKI